MREGSVSDVHSAMGQQPLHLPFRVGVRVRENEEPEAKMPQAGANYELITQTFGLCRTSCLTVLPTGHFLLDD